MKKLIIAAVLLLALGVNNSIAQAQNVVREGKKDTLLTSYRFEDSKGTLYPIIINKASGRCYVWKRSGKTGNMYKRYMKPEVSRQIAKELNIPFKESKKCTR
jgi:hypothetical protein